MVPAILAWAGDSTSIAEELALQSRILDGAVLQEVQAVLMQEPCRGAQVQVRLLPHHFWIEGQRRPLMPAVIQISIYILDLVLSFDYGPVMVSRR